MDGYGEGTRGWLAGEKVTRKKYGPGVSEDNVETQISLTKEGV